MTRDRREWYKANREKIKARATQWNNEHPKDRARNSKQCHEARKAFVQEQKLGKVCAHCGESNIRLLVFHHVDPATKLFEVGPSYRDNQAILDEIAKCILLCKSCHSKHHNPRKQV
jgi:hypothetical protein